MSAPVVFQCASCRSILSDTLSYLVSSDAERRTVTVSEARLVNVAPERVMSTGGWDTDCAFRQISCTQCHRPLGRMYVATTQHLSHLQNAYTFASDALVSYQLGSLALAAKNTSGRDSNVLTAHERLGGVVNESDWHRGMPRMNSKPHLMSSVNQSASTFDPTVKLAVTELDQHVCKLTTAMNQVTNAQKRTDIEVGHALQGLKELQLEHRETRTKVQAVTDNLGEVDSELVKMENMFLVWEERFQRIEAALAGANNDEKDGPRNSSEGSLKNTTSSPLTHEQVETQEVTTDEENNGKKSRSRGKSIPVQPVRALRSNRKQRLKRDRAS